MVKARAGQAHRQAGQRQGQGRRRESGRAAARRSPHAAFALSTIEELELAGEEVV